ncbi:hypothetical protein ACTFIU_010126 [Dictyostelium citrinum]
MDTTTNINYYNFNNKIKEYEILILGSKKTGESSLLCQFLNDGKYFETYLDQIYKKLITIENDEVNYMNNNNNNNNNNNYNNNSNGLPNEYILKMIDSGNQSIQNKEIRKKNIRNANGFILLYSVDSIESFEEIKEIHSEILKIRETKQVPLIIVGNKCDLSVQRLILPEQGEKLAIELGYTPNHFIESSAKYNIRVMDIFINLTIIINNFQNFLLSSSSCSLSSSSLTSTLSSSSSITSSSSSSSITSISYSPSSFPKKHKNQSCKIM